MDRLVDQLVALVEKKTHKKPQIVENKSFMWILPLLGLVFNPNVWVEIVAKPVVSF